jgi:hypothetical protein
MGINTNKLKDLYKKCLLLLFAGAAFILATFIFSNAIKTESAFFNAFGEGLSIIGWVFLWDLVEILCFDVSKLRKKRKYLKRLIDSKVEFETY